MANANTDAVPNEHGQSQIDQSMLEALEQELLAPQTPQRNTIASVPSVSSPVPISSALPNNEGQQQQQRQWVAPLQDRPQALHRERVGVDNPSGRIRANSRTPRTTKNSNIGSLPNVPGGPYALQGQSMSSKQ